jgi:hypothetical protein
LVGGFPRRRRDKDTIDVTSAVRAFELRRIAAERRSRFDEHLLVTRES